MNNINMKQHYINLIKEVQNDDNLNAKQKQAYIKWISQGFSLLLRKIWEAHEHPQNESASNFYKYKI